MCIVSIFLHWMNSYNSQERKPTEVLLFPELLMGNRNKRSKQAAATQSGKKAANAGNPEQAALQGSGKWWAGCHNHRCSRLIRLQNKRKTSCFKDVPAPQKRKMYGMYWFWRTSNNLSTGAELEDNFGYRTPQQIQVWISHATEIPASIICCIFQMQ